MRDREGLGSTSRILEFLKWKDPISAVGDHRSCQPVFSPVGIGPVGFLSVHVEEVNLVAQNLVLPHGGVGMVVAQPCLALTAEPFRCQQAAREGQLAAIQRTLALAKTPTHGAEKTHFTIFPEYSIPGQEGVKLIDDALRDPTWPTGTVVIGGTDALSKADYASICAGESTIYAMAQNGPDKVADDEWVNCAITWVKSGDGQVSRWLQPKIAPAWPEFNIAHQRMFRGGSVYVFRAAFDNNAPCRFFSLVCFDWVAEVAGVKVWRAVLDALNVRAVEAGAEIAISWAFVIQHNPKPSHDMFLGGVAEFFQKQGDYPLVRRERACVLFANTGGKSKPCRVKSHGSSGLVFSPIAPFGDATCHPTFSEDGKRLRASQLLGPCKDVLFREGGACIHSFTQRLPGSIGLDAAGRTLALDRPHVHPIALPPDDPRAPGGHVPASVKWLNDVLDDSECLSHRHPAVVLATSVPALHAANVEALRRVDSVEIERRISNATSESPATSADAWDEAEDLGLEHVVHTLDLLRLAFSNMEVRTSMAHGTVSIRDQLTDVLAIHGASHDKCFEHSKRFVPHPRRLLLIVSRDRDNIPLLPRFGSILSPQKGRIGDAPKITDPESGKVHLGYQDLLAAYLPAQSVAELEDAFYARLSA